MFTKPKALGPRSAAAIHDSLIAALDAHTAEIAKREQLVEDQLTRLYAERSRINEVRKLIG